MPKKLNIIYWISTVVSLLALSGHLMVQDSDHYLALVAFIAVIISYLGYRNLYASKHAI